MEFSVSVSGTYRIKVTDSNNTSLTSDAVYVKSISELTVVKQPTNAVMDGEVVLTALALGGTPNYTIEWQSFDHGKNAWSRAERRINKEEAYSEFKLSDNYFDYLRNDYDGNTYSYVAFRCVITDSDGTQTTSDTAYVTTEALKATVSDYAYVATAEIEGISVTASGGSGSGYTYQWQMQKTTFINGMATVGWINLSGATESVYKPLSGQGVYRCKVTDPIFGSVYSDKITVYPSMSIADQTTDAQSLSDNDGTVQIYCEVTGGKPGYTAQWREYRGKLQGIDVFAYVDLSDTTHYSVENVETASGYKSILTVKGITGIYQSKYQCYVSDGGIQGICSTYVKVTE